MSIDSQNLDATPPFAAANTNSEQRPLRLRIPALLDVVLVSEPQHIAWLNQHPCVTRQIDPTRSLLHRFIASRLLSDLAFHGQLLPVFLARADEQRAQRQKELDQRLEGLRGAPGEEHDEIAAYVSGQKDALEIGVLVQQWCGKLFREQYRADHESYSAGSLVAGWASAPPWRTLLDRMSGKLQRAKERLWRGADGDAYCVHATSIGMENITKSVRKLRSAAQDPDKQQLSPDDILRQCLAAPPAVLRSCTQQIQAPFLSAPLGRRSVIVLLVAKAFARSGDLDVAFLGDQWSACPARRVVPELLRAAWHSAHHDERADADAAVNHGGLPRWNGWSRLWQRGVS